MSVVPPPVLQFKVAGPPVTEGSMKGFIVGRRVNIVPSNAKALTRWRDDVAIVAKTHMSPYGTWVTLAGPVRVRILFVLPRPVSYPARERRWPIAKTAQHHGDIDKFARAILDACTTAGVWHDDSQVTDLHAIKDYPGYGPAVRVREPAAYVSIWDADDRETLL